MLLRVIIATFFLGGSAVVQLQMSDSYLTPQLIYIYSLIVSVYLFTFLYIFLMTVINNFQGFAYAQVLIDVVLVTALIFITGGIKSIFPFMYTISIISASSLLYLSGGIIIATSSGLFYCVLIYMEHFNFIKLMASDHSSLFFPVTTCFAPETSGISKIFLGQFFFF